MPVVALPDITTEWEGYPDKSKMITIGLVEIVSFPEARTPGGLRAQVLAGGVAQGEVIVMAGPAQVERPASGGG
jgi:hypothetical protein